MKTGRKSIIFGVHQFIWHPITVLIAWVRLYGWPNWKELICIIIHDWGYWNCKNMDDEEGEKHPEFAAILAWKLGPKYSELCLMHSRHYARLARKEPSKLCWADKLSIVYDPWWFYLPRAIMSGEIKEYRLAAIKFVPLSASHREWFSWVREYLAKQGIEQRATILINPERIG